MESQTVINEHKSVEIQGFNVEICMFDVENGNFDVGKWLACGL